MRLAGMAANRSTALRAGVFTFPLEFAALKPQLRAFLGTLFEENTWQFKPVFRGFYFTSALQEGSVENLSSRRVASRFELKPGAAAQPSDDRDAQGEEQSGYFLLQLFRKVIFADRDLVRRYTSPAAARLKVGVFFAATILLGCALGGWSWSYMGNRQLVASVQADLDKVTRCSRAAPTCNRAWKRWTSCRTASSSSSATAANGRWRCPSACTRAALERKLRDEYFAGVRETMVLPVAGALENLLAEMNANAAQLDPDARAAAGRRNAGRQLQPGLPECLRHQRRRRLQRAQDLSDAGR
jgi:type VI secretion system protein ImpL